MLHLSVTEDIDSRGIRRRLRDALGQSNSGPGALSNFIQAYLRAAHFVPKTVLNCVESFLVAVLTLSSNRLRFVVDGSVPLKMIVRLEAFSTVRAVALELSLMSPNVLVEVAFVSR